MKVGMVLPITLTINEETKDAVGLSKATLHITFSPITKAQKIEFEKKEKEYKKAEAEVLDDRTDDLDEKQEELESIELKVTADGIEEAIGTAKYLELIDRRTKIKKEIRKITKEVEELSKDIDMSAIKDKIMRETLDILVGGKDKENLLKWADKYTSGAEIVFGFVQKAYTEEVKALKNG